MVVGGKTPPANEELGDDGIPAVMDAADFCFDGADVAIDDDDAMIEEEIFGEDGDFVDGEDEVFGMDDGTNQTAETNKFDQIVGVLEEVVMDPEFEFERDSFCRANCTQFEESPENKLVYTELFHQYTEIIENLIDTKLSEGVEGFDMQEFLEMIDSRQDELCAEVFDLLMTMGDFEAFKELMLSYKVEVVEGKSFEISVLSMPIHTEEQEDGDQRPDLDFGLNIASLAVKAK